ncbi:MAG: galactokinase family protein, partial [Candidatus Thorarchaeota archaeon]
MKSFQVRAPGRICLFGEHSDYIGLDVIPSAITLAIEIEGRLRDDAVVSVDYLDLKEDDEFHIDKELEYRHQRDYLRSAFSVLKREGIRPKQGADLRVRGKIPMGGGLSSSSALAVASVLTVMQLSNHYSDPESVARLAHQVEVIEFGESGGMQDHYGSSFGGIIHLDLGKDYKVTQLPARLSGIIIGDSEEPKTDSVGDIKSLKETVENEYRMISESIEFDRRTTPINNVYGLSRARPSESRSIAEATLRNRDLTQRAFLTLNQSKVDLKVVGGLLDEHHEILRDGLHRSTPKIERMINAAKNAGAIGCKMNGSGG